MSRKRSNLLAGAAVAAMLLWAGGVRFLATHAPTPAPAVHIGATLEQQVACTAVAAELNATVQGADVHSQGYLRCTLAWADEFPPGLRPALPAEGDDN